MRILITGGAGFIGSHLADLLIAEGNHVIALDDQSTGSISNLKSDSRLEIIEGSILDTKLIDSLILPRLVEPLSVPPLRFLWAKTQ